MPPWDKYQTAAPTANKGPWEKYGSDPEREAARERNAQHILDAVVKPGGTAAIYKSPAPPPMIARPDGVVPLLKTEIPAQQSDPLAPADPNTKTFVIRDEANPEGRLGTYAEYSRSQASRPKPQTPEPEAMQPNRNWNEKVGDWISGAVTPAAQSVGEMIGGQRPGINEMARDTAGGLSEWAATAFRDPYRGASEAVDMLEPTHLVAEGYNDLKDSLADLFRGDTQGAWENYKEATVPLLSGVAGMLPGGSAVVSGLEKAAARGGGQSIGSQLFKPGPTAVDRAADIVIKKMKADGLTLDDLKKVQRSLANRGDSGVYETLSELAGLSDKSSGANLRGLAMALASVPGPAQEAIIARVAENANKLPQRVSRAATRATGQSADNAVASLDALDARLKTEAAPAYDAFYATPVNNQVFSAQILPTLTTEPGQAATRSALRGLQTEEAALKAAYASGKQDAGAALERVQKSIGSLQSFLADPLRGSTPTAQALDHIKRAFDDQIEAAGHGSYTAKNLRAAKNNFSESVDRATNGTYGQALGSYEGVKRLEEAFDIGLNAMKQKTWELERDMSKGLNGRAWSKGEIEAIAMGVARHVEDLIEANDQRALTTLLKGKALKNMATALGDPKAAAIFEQSIQRLGANREWGRRVSGGSDTAMRLAAIDDATRLEEDPVTRVLDRAANSTAPPSIFGAAWQAIAKPAANAATDAYRRLKYPGIRDEEVNAALAPVMGNAMTRGNLDEVAAIIEQRLAAKAGNKKLPPPPGGGPPPVGGPKGPKALPPVESSSPTRRSPPAKMGFGGGSKPLDMSEPARMQRAREQGFDVETTYYHGGNSQDDIRPGRDGLIFLTKDPEFAGVYAKSDKENANIKPVFIRGNLMDRATADSIFQRVETETQLFDEAKRLGYSGIELDGETIMFDPKDIRGKFAAFDPSQSGSSKLLAGIPAGAPEALGAGAGGAAGYFGAQDTNGDGVVDDNERRAQAFGGMVTGVLGTKALRSGIGRIKPPPAIREGANETAKMTFGGVNAKTADKKLLGIAQQMEKAGAGRDQIWRETGWYKGVDGKWKFEIDDSGFAKNLPDNPSYFGPLNEIATDADAGGAYPDIGNSDVYLNRSRIASGAAAYDYGENAPAYMRAEGPNAKKQRQTLAHERQHLVQAKEGFSTGSSPDDLMPEDKFFGGKYPLSSAKAYRDYRRTAGEVEARNVERRLDMTPEQRKATPPWKTQDVPDHKQIVNFGSGRAESRGPWGPRNQGGDFSADIPIITVRTNRGEIPVTASIFKGDRGEVVMSPEWPSNAFEDAANALKTRQDVLENGFASEKAKLPDWNTANPQEAAQVEQAVAQNFIATMKNNQQAPAHVLALLPDNNNWQLGRAIEDALPKGKQLLRSKNGGEFAVVDRRWAKQNPDAFPEGTWEPAYFKYNEQFDWVPKDTRPMNQSVADRVKPPPRSFEANGFGFGGGKGLIDKVIEGYGNFKQALLPNDSRNLNAVAEALQSMPETSKALVNFNAGREIPQAAIAAADTPPQLAELVGRVASQSPSIPDRQIDKAVKQYQTSLADQILSGNRAERDLINMDKKAGPVGPLEKEILGSYDWTPAREAQQEAALADIIREGMKPGGGIPNTGATTRWSPEMQQAGRQNTGPASLPIDRFREGMARGADQPPIVLSPRDEQRLADLIFNPAKAKEAAAMMNDPVKPWVSDIERRAIQVGVPATGLAAMIAAGSSLYGNQDSKAGDSIKLSDMIGGAVDQIGRGITNPSKAGIEKRYNDGLLEASRQDFNKPKFDSNEYTVSDRVMPTNNPAEPPVELNAHVKDTFIRAQQRLMALGYAPKKLTKGDRFDDGVDGQQTREAVSRFQRDKNLPVTGDLDPMTLRTLWDGKNYMAMPTMREYGREPAEAPR